MTEETLVALLMERFNPHTILLYGSRARGDATPESDWDVACLADVAEPRHLGWCEVGTFFDVFVYPALDGQDPEQLRLLGSRVLLDDRGLAAPLLEKLAALEARGPKPMPDHQLAMERSWIAKMVERVRRGQGKRGDLEAHHRRHWLLKDLLEYSFTLRGRWYQGPKRALETLHREEPELWALFADALPPDAEFAQVERLAQAVAELGRAER